MIDGIDMRLCRRRTSCRRLSLVTPYTVSSSRQHTPCRDVRTHFLQRLGEVCDFDDQDPAIACQTRP